MSSQRVVLCEGYHDRAFWAEWLRTLGCGNWPRTGKVVLDPWNGEVKGGQFGFLSASGGFVRLQPCQGKQGLVPAARLFLGNRATEPVEHLVLNVDVDDPDTPSLADAALADLARRFDTEATPDGHGGWLLDGGATHIHVVRWQSTAPETAGVPRQETLERLVCAALSTVYPERGAAVQQWLDGRPDPPGENVKAYAWSHMAGWYPDCGCEAFYRAIWGDEAVAAALREALTASGAWRIAELVAA